MVVPQNRILRIVAVVPQSRILRIVVVPYCRVICVVVVPQRRVQSVEVWLSGYGSPGHRPARHAHVEFGVHVIRHHTHALIESVCRVLVGEFLVAQNLVEGVSVYHRPLRRNVEEVLIAPCDLVVRVPVRPVKVRVVVSVQ